MDIRDVRYPGWEVVEEIGSGSYGNVYKIRRTLVNMVEYAALKIITIPKSAKEIDDYIDDGYERSKVTEHYKKQKDNIAGEYELMASLKGCPNIVHAEDILIVPQSNDVGWDIYIRMEILTPLKKVARNMQESDIIKMGMDICNALMACKKNDVIHRDIKPANLFVSDTGVYKLGDFGVAKTSAKTQRGTYAGTEQFMAPEVSDDEAYGTSVDIYSLGLVMYWLLNNRRFPFVPQGIVPIEEENLATKRRLSGEALPDPVNGSRELKNIVLKACAFDPRARFESAEAMYYALAGLSGITSAPRTESVKVDQRFVDYDDGFTVGTYGAGTNRSDATVSGSTLRGKPPVQESTVREETVKQSFVKKEVPKQSAPKQSTPKREAPKQSAPKKRVTVPVQSMDEFFHKKISTPVKRERKKFRIKKLKLKHILVIAAILFFVGPIIPAMFYTLFKPDVTTTESSQKIAMYDKHVTVWILKWAEKRAGEVKSLEFTSCTFDDEAWTRLNNYTALEKIGISNCDITDEEFACINFAEMTQLVEVRLGSNEELTDISPLYVIGGQIKRLSLIGNGKIPDNPVEGLGAVEGLQAFTNLEELSLHSFYLNGHYVSNLEPIASLTTLKKLSISGPISSRIVDITPLANLTELVDLDLSDNEISDISALSSLTKLERLDLSFNKIQDISALRELVNMDDLNIAYNEISDITSLENMTGLSILDISSNPITSLNGLENAHDLWTVRARDMETLTDISALEANGKADILHRE